MVAIARILVPLDLHGLGEARLPLVAAQARAFDAEVIVLHVYPPERAPREGVSPVEARARTYLDAIAARLHAEGIVARPLVRRGAPAEIILQEIEAEDVGLVILASTRRHSLSWLRLGSVAEEVVARAPCPVLLVRPPSGKVAGPPAVRSFTEDAARAGPVAPRELGLRTVEVARIVGSVGRAAELEATFRGRTPSRADEARFGRILRLMEEGAALPPVDLYKLGYGYYVLDGNHRVAAAKQLGQLEIDALVTEFLPLGDVQAQRVAAERRAFERATGLRRIGAAVPGHYPRLEEMIRSYAAERGLPNLRDAALQWQAEVYQPVAEQIRRRRVLERLPGERTADVFVRMAERPEDPARDAGRVVALPHDIALPHDSEADRPE